MRKYSTIIFDLDGTLTEPSEGIFNSIRHALAYFGIEEKNTENLSKFIGPPLQKSFQLNFDFSEEQAKKAVDYYREYFTSKGIFENYLFPGIITILENLQQKNCTLFVGTSKPTIFANQILEHFKIKKYFKEVIGASMDLSRVNKSDIINLILEKNGIINDKLKMEQVLMIGDTKFDIEGAQTCNIDSLAVLYGHGTESSLLNANPTHIVNKIEELENFIMQNT